MGQKSMRYVYRYLWKVTKAIKLQEKEVFNSVTPYTFFCNISIMQGNKGFCNMQNNEFLSLININKI